MSTIIIDAVALFIDLVDRVVVNWWTQAPQGYRVLALFFFIGCVYLVGEVKGEEKGERNERAKQKRRRCVDRPCKGTAHSSRVR